MARLAVFSDVHSNLPALEAVLADVDAVGLDRVYCLGDLVGYAPFPNEACALVRERGIETVMGNYDDGTGFDRDECGCAYRDADDKARGDLSFTWTKARTDEDNKAWLQTLRPNIRLEADGKRFLLVHGSPRRMNEYVYEDRPVSSLENIARAAEADVLVMGHTHLPYVKQVAEVLFINVGSAGKPKDGDPRACWALMDTGNPAAVEFRRIPYDVSAVASAIRASELPDYFADVLERAAP
jgi:putative phosphoesterase